MMSTMVILYTGLFHRIGMLEYNGGNRCQWTVCCFFLQLWFDPGLGPLWLLFLNHGIFEGDTVLSPEWVEYMKAPAPASDGYYAGTFWLKEPE